MATRKAPDTVEWLLREGGDEQGVPASSHMTFEDRYWRATIERIDIGRDLRVYVTRAEVRRSLSLAPVQSTSGPWLCSNIAIKGSVAMSFADGARFRLSPARAILFRPKDGTARFAPAPRQTLHLVGYFMSAARVIDLCEGKVPERIRPLLAAEPERSLVLSQPTTGHMRRVAARMLSDQITGVMRPIYLEGLALQLFAIQSGPVTGATTLAAVSARERRALHEARERLLHDISTPPTGAELAAAVGMSERRLNGGFKVLFGATIFEVLRNERLEHARIVLEQEGLPLKVVASRVGYRHVTNFISAFTARYGNPPRQLIDGREGGAPAPRGGSATPGG